jgi:hypothetical protein
MERMEIQMNTFRFGTVAKDRDWRCRKATDLTSEEVSVTLHPPTSYHQFLVLP